MKKFNKLYLLALFIPLFIIFMGSKSFAATGSAYFSLYNKSIGRPTGYYTVSVNGGATKPVIKIIKTNSAGTVDDTPVNSAVYCLKDGVGFGSESGTVVGPIEYTQNFNMKSSDFVTSSTVYRNQLPTNITTYNEIVWILEHLSIPTQSKADLYASTGLSDDDFLKYLNDTNQVNDVIEVIQQAAIWYYANSTTPADQKYQPLEDALFYYSSNANGTPYELTNLNKKEGQDFVDNPFTKLYDYFVDGAANAVQNGYTYQTGTAGTGVTLDKSNATVTTSGSNYIIGPYKIVAGSNYSLTSASVLADSSELSNVTILGSDKSTALTGSTTKDKLANYANRNFYISLPNTTSASSVTINISSSYSGTNLTYWSTSANQVSSNQPVVVIEKASGTSTGTDTKTLAKPVFDLALRKFIVSVNGTNVTTSREPVYTQNDLKNLALETSTSVGTTTLIKKHTKDPVSVKEGDRVVYKIRIYNEGSINGYATEITDYLPSGLQLAQNSTINNAYGWQMYDESGKATTDYNAGKIIKTSYLSNRVLSAFDKAPSNGTYSISYEDVQVECVVNTKTSTTDIHLKNVAEITGSKNGANQPDRDSTTNNLTGDQKNNYAPGTSTVGKGYEDDDDYEDLIIPGRYFDLALRKFISKVNDKEYDRAPKYNVSPLLNGDTTADYYHKKSAVSVEAGDTVTYTIRVYNEGQVDGYVDEITDHLPPELQFINNDFNANNGWVLDPSDTTQRTVKTQKLSKANDAENIIKSFDQTKTTLNYKEVQIQCKVVETAPLQKEITNIAEITKSSNEYNLADRDNKANATIPSDSDLPNYKGNSNNKSDLSDSSYYYEGQEDDDDFEKVILEKFDLALRKFITGVNNNKITNRVPEVDTSKFGTIVDGKEVTTCTYNHTKEPVRVEQNDTVIYTIRIFNEGTQAGYASVIKDDVPDGLQFLPDNETNKAYKWIMLDQDGKQTSDATKAKFITTDYLSKDQEKTQGSNLINAFDKSTMNTPEYKDVKVAFKVTEPNTSNRIIINKAQISKHTNRNGEEINDVDSTPDVWNEGEDDQDIEKIYVKYFDLSLRKWVTQAIVIEDGVQKVMDTGHYAEQDPEPVVKVEINKKRLEDTVIKFKYSIRVKNEGEIAGYATELSDYIPNGLKFNQADNPNWAEADGKITTDALKDTLLQPGDTATVDLLLTWDNNENNMGVMTNVAEISADKNDSNTHDIDSTPNNKKEGEDDIDDAPVALTAVAGTKPQYIALIGTVLAIIGTGIGLIIKFVL